MLGNRGSRIASWIISFLPSSRWNGLKRWLLKTLGGIEIGKGTRIVSGARFNGRYIKIGENCHIGERCFLMAPDPDAWITIGDWCSFGPEVFMSTGGHDPAKGTDHRTNGVFLPITLGNHVGVCVRTMVMPGVTIGDNCQLSPGVVISRNVKSNVMVSSAPVRSVELPPQ